jgi:signal transduction histidine kinase
MRGRGVATRVERCAQRACAVERGAVAPTRQHLHPSARGLVQFHGIDHDGARLRCRRRTLPFACVRLDGARVSVCHQSIRFARLISARRTGDPDQLDQALINIVRNAADAAVETDGGVRISWHTADAYVAIEIEDDGPGLASTANLFTPFFTTKPNGSGIGLALSRQIIEAHGGTVDRGNRVAARGCLATIRLPVGVGQSE